MVYASLAWLSGRQGCSYGKYYATILIRRVKSIIVDTLHHSLRIFQYLKLTKNTEYGALIVYNVYSLARADTIPYSFTYSLK